MGQGLSSITVNEEGSISEKGTGKKIVQKFSIKIYTDKLGEAAREELTAIKEKFEKKVGSNIRGDEGKPRQFPSSYAT